MTLLDFDLEKLFRLKTIRKGPPNLKGRIKA